MGAHLMSAHHLPLQRTTQILADLYRTPAVSTGWLAGLAGHSHTLLEDFDTWVHVAGTDALTCYDIHPKRGREAMEAFIVLPAFVKAGPTHPLIRRLDARREDHLRFAADFGVPFTSNAAEQDLRMVKLQVKVSGGWRTLAGAERFCRIRSFFSTLKKQGLTVLDKLTDLFAGNAWIPSTT